MYQYRSISSCFNVLLSILRFIKLNLITRNPFIISLARIYIGLYLFSVHILAFCWYMKCILVTLYIKHFKLVLTSELFMWIYYACGSPEKIKRKIGTRLRPFLAYYWVACVMTRYPLNHMGPFYRYSHSLIYNITMFCGVPCTRKGFNSFVYFVSCRYVNLCGRGTEEKSYDT